MSDISIWILSIAGIICLSVFVELLMPEGQMNKYIKSIFSFLIILVIIIPFPKLFKKEIDKSNLFNFQDIAIQSEYVKEVNNAKINEIKKDIEKEFENYGYLNVKLTIPIDIFDEKMGYRAIYVNLKNIVISENSEHKNILEIKEDIKTIIKKYIELNEVYFEE